LARRKKEGRIRQIMYPRIEKKEERRNGRLKREGGIAARLKTRNLFRLTLWGELGRNEWMKYAGNTCIIKGKRKGIDSGPSESGTRWGEVLGVPTYSGSQDRISLGELGSEWGGEIRNKLRRGGRKIRGVLIVKSGRVRAKGRIRVGLGAFFMMLDLKWQRGTLNIFLFKRPEPDPPGI